VAARGLNQSASGRQAAGGRRSGWSIHSRAGAERTPRLAEPPDEAGTRHVVRVERDVVVGHEQVVELGVHASPAGRLVGPVLDHRVVTEGR